ncbi:hypothetical protein [Pseudomonas protegens]|uniref:hypothetical protein n=1 Tax=Pseudomonas protegens TaxID=380021 RepID=UPI001E59A55A|nr:hypothetical protein [Pseudomonas protegens]MCD9572395.1 hypothetical protein [Pseudomonas protegens]
MTKLEFEKVGDVNTFFPYLCVYFEGEKDPFMEIGISEEEVVEFIFYPGNKLILNAAQWEEILVRSQVFLKVELENKKFE